MAEEVQSLLVVEVEEVQSLLVDLTMQLRVASLPGRTALLAALPAGEAELARELCRMWVVGKGSTCRRPRINTSDVEVISMPSAPGEISRASSPLVVS